MDPNLTVDDLTEEDTAEYEAFIQGFDDKSQDPAKTASKPLGGEETPVSEVDKQAVAPAAPAGKKVSDSTDPNPFDSLPEAVRDMLADIPRLRSQVDSQGQELSRWKGQTAALQSKLDRVNAPTAKPARDALRSTLPEIAAALDEVDPIDDFAPAPAKAATDPTPAPAVAAASEPSKKTASVDELALDLARPSWFTDLDSTDFKLWLATQPKDKQNEVLQTDSSRVIMAALNDFDSHKSQSASVQDTNAARARRIAAGLTPSGDGRRGNKQAAANMTPEQIEAKAMEDAFNGRSP
jgi:hypothetical protein